MEYTLSHISTIIQATATIRSQVNIEYLLLDSRNINNATRSLFFALKGPRRNGKQFIPELYKKGVRCFVIDEAIDETIFPEANFLLVDDTLVALQQLAAFHRQQFTIPIIGITGSNGKTMVKEWLYQLLQNNFNIARSPKSYNSQIGVPLSLWTINSSHNLAIIEAGISAQAEMLRLERMIQPTIGILTTIGEAHSEGFNDPEHKLREKLVLFRNSNVIIGREKDIRLGREVLDLFGEKKKIITWGEEETASVIIKEINKQATSTDLVLSAEGNTYSFTIPFTDEAAIENAITCFCVLKELNVSDAAIAENMLLLQAVNMRLELKKGINNCTLINDSYSADISSLEIALNFLNQQNRHLSKTVILSDLLQSAIPDEELYRLVIEALYKHQINRLICIGDRITSAAQNILSKTTHPSLQTAFYPSTEDFLTSVRPSAFRDEIILIKGARVFAFEKIVHLLEQKAHQTVLEINLNAIAHNLRQYQSLLKPNVKIMAMVKAFAYGSGGAEIAGILQHHKIDYLGVAYADEGVELRKAGITLPIMVMNPDENDFHSIVENNLEPDIYSFDLLHSFDAYLKKEGIRAFPIHIEIETGMNRLGFSPNHISALANQINKTSSFVIKSVFSHLAASEDQQEDSFTQHQLAIYTQAANELSAAINQSLIHHISNSAGILRHPELQLDMVRLGIGLYGIDTVGNGKLQLQAAATWKSTIAQIKKLRTGETVGYNRKGKADKETVIATIRLGYADGYPRRLSNGKGQVWINGKLAPVIGNICMDMLMIDVSQIENIKEGDPVIIFGKELPVQQLAAWAETIPYEIMTGISQRVKRVYFEE